MSISFAPSLFLQSNLRNLDLAEEPGHAPYLERSLLGPLCPKTNKLKLLYNQLGEPAKGRENMTLTKSLELTLWFAGAFLFASFVEYWMHRAMHKFPQTFKTHTQHHVKNTGQGVLWEFISYIKGSLIGFWPPFLYSWQAGIAWSLGAIFYAAFSAYAHQLQHDNPTYCAWMKMPVHYVHHRYNQWHHNFGLGVDWWDKIFGTYQPVEWAKEAKEKFPGGGYLQVKWR